jgi:protein-S-isoprenylcysteine O-methyltransferase Ste14
MASKLLVLLQFATFAALVWRWNAGSWNAWAWLPIGLAFALGAWTIVHNPPTNFGILPEPRANARMITTGPYAWVRHPMYLGLMIFALGLAVGWNTGMHWLSAAALVLVLVVKARREERFMRARFPGYDAYASRTPRLVPGPRRIASG